VLWTRGVGSDEREIDGGFVRGRKIALGSFSHFLQTLKRETILSQVDSGVGEKLTRHPTHDAFVKILATQKSVARSRKHVEDAIVHFENRNIKRAAAEVINCDALDARLSESISQGCRCRLVDDALDFQSGNLACVFCCLSLRVVEIGGDG